MFYLGLFNATELKGNRFKIGAVFSISEALGVFMSDSIVRILPEHVTMILSLVLICVISSWIKVVSMSETVLLSLFLI
jgi:hypothetical protein